MIYAGFWRRFCAFIIDMLLVAIPVMLVFVPVAAAAMLSLGSTPGEISSVQASLLGIIVFSWQVATTVMMWLYFAYFESSAKQATPGKRILGMKVIGADGQRISFGRATARFFSKMISYFFLYIGFIMAGFTNRKQALHDMICETYVVKKEFTPGQELPPTKSHRMWLILVCIVWIAFLLLASLLYAELSISPTQAVAELIKLFDVKRAAERQVDIFHPENEKG